MSLDPRMPDVTVEIAFDSGFTTPAASRTWTDVTQYVETGEDGGPISIRRGGQDERPTIEPSSLSLVLDNRDGRFTPGRASSPYFPNVKIGRPIRVRATTATGNPVTNSTFEVDTSGWGTAGVAATLASVTTEFWQGARSMRITWPTGSAGAASVFCTVSGMTVGRQYTYSAYVRSAATPRVRLKVLAATFSSTSSLSASWQRLSVTFTATATSHQIEVVAADATTAGQISYVDGVMVNRGATANTFTATAPLTTDRFLGYINEWPLEWNNSPESAHASITANSRLARLGNAAALTNIIAEEYRRDSPAAHYQLDNLNDATGNQPPLQRTFKDSGGSGIAVNFTTATGPGTDGLSAATFAAGEWLVARWQPAPTTAPVGSVEFFVLTSTPDRTVLGAPDEGASKTGHVYYCELTAAGKLIIGETSGVSGVSAWSLTSTATVTDGLTRHVAIVCDGSGTDVYFNGALDSSTANNWAGFKSILSVGGSPTYDTNVGVGFTPRGRFEGVLAHLAVYDHALTSGRIFDHAAAGLSGFAGEAPYIRVARYAIYAGVPDLENDFDVDTTPAIAHVDTTEQPPMDLMQRVAVTGGGQFFDGRDGLLRYVTRSNRYDATAAYTLDFEDHDVDPGTVPKLDDQWLINDYTATLIGEDGLAVRAVNDDSRDEYGPRSDSVEMVSDDADMAAYVAHWNVATYNQPSARVPELQFDFLPLSAETHAAVMNADIGSLVTVDNWPSQAASTSADFFIEGYSETITSSEYRIGLHLSPGELWLDTWMLDDDPRGNIDSIYRLAY